MLRFISSFAVLIGVLVVALPAHAAGTLTRTFVASTGSDSNACTVAAPCASFAQAYTQVAANGIVAALDPGKYGPLTITGPVTIDGNGWAAITTPQTGGDVSAGVVINAGSNDAVILRGLLIDGADVQNNGDNGIWFENGQTLTVEKCVVRNTLGTGLQASAINASGFSVVISHTSFLNNYSDGVFVAQFSGIGPVTVSIDQTDVSGTTGGYAIDFASSGTQPMNVALTDSVVVNNLYGVIARSQQGQLNVALTDDQIAGNETGLEADSGVAMWLAKSTVAGNATSFNINGGVVNSYGNNYFANNGSNTGSLTPVGTQ